MRWSNLFVAGSRLNSSRPVQPGPTSDTADAARAPDEVDDIDAQAILWHVRLRNPSSAERDAFTAWIDRDPRHHAAFSAIRTGVANDGDQAAERRGFGARRWGAGGAVAAALAVLIALPTLRSADPYDVTTAPGATRVVALDAGTSVTLNGGTRMQFDRRNPRVASLLTGEALFNVRHDAADPFRLKVAGRVIEDVGTVFNVVNDDDGVRVAVAEGGVVYNPDGEKIALGAGQRLVDGNSSTIRISAIPSDTVGGWRRAQLVYSGQSLSEVAADLSRTLGVRIVAAPSIAARPFSGALNLEDARRLGAAGWFGETLPALALRAERTPDGWIMKPGSGETR